MKQCSGEIKEIDLGFFHNPNDSLGSHPILNLNSNALNEEGLRDCKRRWMWGFWKFKSAAKKGVGDMVKIRTLSEG